MISLYLFLLWAESGEVLIDKLGDKRFEVREMASWTLEKRLSVLDGMDNRLIKLVKSGRNHQNIEIEFRTKWLYEKYHHRFYGERKI